MSGASDLLEELRTLAMAIASETAALHLDRLQHPRETVGTKSTGTDMVTEVDKASEALIVERLLAARPDDAIVGEEGADHSGSSGVRWVVDPLDGTTNYLYRHPGFAVSIAAEIDGHAMVGVVHDSVHHEQFVAVRGRGATRNGEPVLRTDRPPLHESLVATGFAYDPVRRQAQAEVLGRLIGQIRDIRRMGAAAVDLCSVALGRVDAYYERGLAPWDHAAGALVATEAGIEVTDLDGGAAGSHFLVAAPVGLAAELRDLLGSAGAREIP